VHESHLLQARGSLRKMRSLSEIRMSTDDLSDPPADLAVARSHSYRYQFHSSRHTHTQTRLGTTRRSIGLSARLVLLVTSH
jgi:hypothetical protein